MHCGTQDAAGLGSGRCAMRCQHVHSAGDAHVRGGYSAEMLAPREEGQQSVECSTVPLRGPFIRLHSALSWLRAHIHMAPARRADVTRRLHLSSEQRGGMGTWALQGSEAPYGPANAEFERILINI
mmetsp:Transcript_12557/g.41164  ORF Transcript_12557/g.41164 Transcript_12557/m.41164 type:complete len:126 (-) Transcript_12557:13-390(-)